MKDDTPTRVALLEQSISHVNETLIRIDKRFDHLETRMETRFDRMESRIWSLFLWMIGGFVGVLGLLAHSMHWI